MHRAAARNERLSSPRDEADQEQFLVELIGTADSSQAETTAQALLSHFPSLSDLFRAFVACLDQPHDAPSELAEFGKAEVAKKLIAIARNCCQSREIDRGLFNYLINLLGHRSDEALIVLFLGRDASCLDVQILAHGNEKEVTVRTRLLLRAAIRCGAAEFILAHNHPGGNPEPSLLDYQSTLAAEEAAQVVGISLVDHLIIAGTNIYSMRHGCKFTPKPLNTFE